MKYISPLVFASVAMGHNWLKEPIPFGGAKARTQKPCEDIPADYEPTVAAAGSSIQLTWSTNHGGDHHVKMLETLSGVVANDFAAVEALPPIISMAKDRGPSYELQLPTTTGKVLVQYSWANYRNCLYVDVGGGVTTPVVTEEPVDLHVAAIQNANCVAYCQDFVSKCTPTAAPLSAFTDQNECMMACATYPDKEEDALLAANNTIVTGNSLQCRFYHLHVEGIEGTAAQVKSHCAHASKLGGTEVNEPKCTGRHESHVGLSLRLTFKEGQRPPTTAVDVEVAKMLSTSLDDGQVVMQKAVSDGENDVLVIISFKDSAQTTALSSMEFLKYTIDDDMQTAFPSQLQSVSAKSPNAIDTDTSPACAHSLGFASLLALFSALL